MAPSIEDVILDLEGKLYKFQKGANKWKQVVAGSIRFLKHKITNQVRLVIGEPHEEVTCDLSKMSFKPPDAMKDRLVWEDFSDGVLKDHICCILFGSVENLKDFMQMVIKVKYHQVREVTAYNYVTQEAKTKAFVSNETANALFNQKEYSKAYNAYSLAIFLNPNDEKYYCNRSLCLLRLFRANEALNDARISSEFKPDSAKAWYLVGSSLRMLKKFDEAVDAFYEALRLDPENQEIHKACWEAAEAGVEFRALTENCLPEPQPGTRSV